MIKKEIEVKSAEIKALVSLLEDPDPFVHSKVLSRFYELGDVAIPAIDNIRIEIDDSELRYQLEDIIHNLTLSHFEEDFFQILNHGINTTEELEDAAFLLSRFEDPKIDIEPYKAYLDDLASKIREGFTEEMNERQKVYAILNHVFKKSGYSGQLEEYHKPENCFIHHTIAAKNGLPISLALVVMFIGNRLDVNFQGMNMPIHFMLLYRLERETLFIDPFGSGQVATYDQCYYFLKQNGITPRAEHFRTATYKEIFCRLLRNLVLSYEKQGDDVRADYLQKVLNAIEMHPA